MKDMSQSLRDLRPDFRRRLELLSEKFAQATTIYTERKQQIEREYRDAISRLEAERNAVEYLLEVEERRWASFATLEALEEAIGTPTSTEEERAAPSSPTLRAVK
jgi:hypothetical protein